MTSDASFYPLAARLQALPHVSVERKVPLSRLTRFAVGGPAEILAATRDPDSFVRMRRLTDQSGMPWMVLGDGTNVIAADEGYRGVVLRYTGSRISLAGSTVTVEVGASLQSMVDFTIRRGLAGIHTMTGIPGGVGAAIYGNAGAYGNSISGCVEKVRCFDGAAIRDFDRAACHFAYRESVFKVRKEWTILSAELRFEPGNPVEMAQQAASIREIRDSKYPPSMRCAGSIFKNLLFAELPDAAAARVPASVVREGKVPSAWFLEQVGAKGMRVGGIQVAAYHANLIYNDGGGTARDLRAVAAELKRRVREEFEFELEEEVQYVGFG